MKKILLSFGLFIASFATMAQVGFGTTSPEGALDVVSTNSGIIVPRVVNTAAVTSPVNGMLMYDLSTDCFKVFVGGVWSDCFGQNAEAVAVAAIVAASNDPADGTPSIADLTDIGLTDVTGDQSAYEEAIANANPVPITLPELQAIIDLVNNPPFHTTIVEVTGPNGNIWMDRNLGATQAATSSSDPAAYGDYYQWGRGTDGHEKLTSGTTTTQSVGDTPGHGDFIIGSEDWRLTQNDNLWQGVDGTNNPCPAGFRIPTAAEWLGLGFNNQNDATNSTLKLAAAGTRRTNNTLYLVGRYSNHWSSNVGRSGGREDWARRFAIDIIYVYASEAARANGYPVRCIKD